jgi:diguanylate cyclase (GGDEF)-like protein
VQLGPIVLLKLLRLDSTDERFQRDLFERAVRDPLTGLYNRSYFFNQIGQLSDRSVAQGLQLAVLMLDIDHFKVINDRYGHLVGDRVLCEVAIVIREVTRPEDVVARFGGEEFVIALPVSTPNLATEFAERVRATLASRRTIGGFGEIRITASLGVACWPHGRSVNPFSLIRTADHALYQAKTNGRNRVVFEHAAISETEEIDTVF